MTSNASRLGYSGQERNSTSRLSSSRRTCISSSLGGKLTSGRTGCARIVGGDRERGESRRRRPQRRHLCRFDDTRGRARRKRLRQRGGSCGSSSKIRSAGCSRSRFSTASSTSIPNASCSATRVAPSVRARRRRRLPRRSRIDRGTRGHADRRSGRRAKTSPLPRSPPVATTIARRAEESRNVHSVRSTMTRRNAQVPQARPRRRQRWRGRAPPLRRRPCHRPVASGRKLQAAVGHRQSLEASVGHRRVAIKCIGEHSTQSHVDDDPKANHRPAR